MLSPETAYWLVVLWFAAIGAVIGSFLNVVVYRVPEGISLIDPPSHCVSCKRGIRWFDNVPIFGWLKLRGRCRYCRSTISVRYPLVEALVAAMFGVLAAVEYLSAGANLPPRVLPATGGLDLTGPSAIQLYALYLYHLTLLCTLLCAALIEVDRKRPPVRLFHFALAVGLVAPLVWPGLRPWPAGWPWAAWPELPGWAQGAVDGVDGVAGLAAGGLLAGAVWWGGWKCNARRQGATNGRGFMMPAIGLSLVCAGLFLGWQAAVVLAAGTALVELALLPPRLVWPRLRIPATAVLMSLSLAWILFWARLVSPWQA